MAEHDTISVVLPVHAGVDPDHWAAALASVASQSLQATEIVIVEDGPLTSNHAQVLEAFIATGAPVVRVVLPVNGGAGVANQAGLTRATGTWIAKADADDICLPERFERQMDELTRSGADLCGAAMLEFVDAPDNVVAIRSVPLDHEAIARRMRFNNPVNHPTAMFRRTAALDAGGYADLRHIEDYDLLARMLANGAVMANLAEPLVLFRAGTDMHKRRSSRLFVLLEWQLQHRLRDYGIIGTPRLIANLVVRLAFRFLPPPVLRLVYRRVLSSPVPTSTPGGASEVLSGR